VPAAGTSGTPAATTLIGVPFRFSRRRSLGKGVWIGLSKSGPSIGRRGRRGSVSLSRRGPSVSVRLAKGLSWFKRF